MSTFGVAWLGFVRSDGDRAVNRVFVHERRGPLHQQLLHEGCPCRECLLVAPALHFVLNGGPCQIDLQLAKQAYRLAAWLNVIFDGNTNLP